MANISIRADEFMVSAIIKNEEIQAEVSACHMGNGWSRVTATYPSTIVRSPEQAEGIAEVVSQIPVAWKMVQEQVEKHEAKGIS